MANLKFIQSQSFQLQASGQSSGDTTITLQSFNYPDGTNIVTSDLGDYGFGTLEPNNGNQEEAIRFTGVTQNANGTVTLTGVYSVGFKYPYTATSGLAKSHAGGSTFILSNDAAFYGNIKTYIDGIAVGATGNADQTTKGIVEIATAAEINAGTATGGTGAALAITPDQLILSNYVVLAVPAGQITAYAGRTAPSGYLLCDGTAYSRSTYAALFAAIAPSHTVTISIAAPAVVTYATHGLVTGDQIHLTTTGGLPSGLATNTNYYVSVKDSGTFWLFDTQAHAILDAGAGTGTGIINTGGSQSGVHTLYASNWGKGDGSTTFNVPDYRGLTPYGYKASDSNFAVLNTGGTYVGEKTHQLTTAELASHSHAVASGAGNYSTTGAATGSGGSGEIILTKVTSSGNGNNVNPLIQVGGGSDTAHNNLPPYVVTNFIIKT